MTSIVHGATGAQGAPVLSILRAGGHPVLGASRSPRDLPAGVDGAAVDLADTAALTRLYRGASGVFVHLPLGAPEVLGAYAESIGAAVAKARPVRVVVSTSGQVVDAPGSPLQAPDASPIMTLLRRIEAAGVSAAVVAPRLFLENLLLPVVLDPVITEGTLEYPLPAELPVSWSSHRDVAAVAARLLTDSAFEGTVGVGALPGLTGPDLASVLGAALGREVRYSPITPEEFGARATPLLGAAAVAPVVGLYRALGNEESHTAPEAGSAQALLGTEPLTVSAWAEQVLGASALSASSAGPRAPGTPHD